MATSKISQEYLDILEEAVASGHKKVRLNNREVEYQSVSQMKQAINYISNKLNAIEEAAGRVPRRPRAFRARCRNGL